MKIQLIFIFLLTFISCSITGSRKPSSSHISNYERNGVHFIEINLLLTKFRRRLDIPYFKIRSVDYTDSNVKLNVKHSENINCYNGLNGDLVTSCSLKGNSPSVLKLIYSFEKNKSFPVHEVSWRKGCIKNNFSHKEILQSKIFQKMKLKKGLFLSEKLFLIGEFADAERVDLMYPRRKTFKFDTMKSELIVIDNFKSNLSHSEYGPIEVEGLAKSNFLNDRFHNSKLNPYEFSCRTKKQNYRLDEGIILFENVKAKERVTCSFNSRLRKIFERLNVKGNLEFSIKHLDLEKTFEILENNQQKMLSKLELILSKIDQENIDNIYDGLLKLEEFKYILK